MIDVGWARQLHQAGSDSGLAVAADALVVHERHTRLVSVDPADGSTRWDVHVGNWPRAVVITGRRCLVLPQHPDKLLCLDLDTGERIWSSDLRRFTGHLVVAGDVVLVGGWRGYTPLRVLDTATGQVRWETDDCVHTVRPVVAEGGFLIGEPGSPMVRLIDRQELRELTSWSLPQPLVGHDNQAVFTTDDGRGFLVRCGSRSVVEIAPSEGTVREVVLAESDLGFSAPVHVNGLLWIYDREAGFTVADPGDGRVLRRVDVRQPLVDQVVPVGNGFVVAGTNGTLFHLDADGQVITRVTVSRRIRALRTLDSVRVLAMAKGTLLAARVGNSASHE
ncbi:outer membrane protein assembly factor BamB [Saccharothrix ecbatanensis]|uniref:Outer membrane protein assembly factor BamB n=1 Tax=Saccharothrix ecbatanensis TaxID=1105145 RepID=A0A7W9LYX4_9PSEU|nr:PQQ-binding-like beta-propeller repeat protein [Saccharothrix ecbatanensis]MBB5801310.1 outer membrane protein assembly factor BamB [Saccharothrix ecbatanensis]